jgi:hypothetical protein
MASSANLSHEASRSPENVKSSSIRCRPRVNGSGSPRSISAVNAQSQLHCIRTENPGPRLPYQDYDRVYLHLGFIVPLRISDASLSSSRLSKSWHLPERPCQTGMLVEGPTEIWIKSTPNTTARNQSECTSTPPSRVLFPSRPPQRANSPPSSTPLIRPKLGEAGAVGFGR